MSGCPPDEQLETGPAAERITYCGEQPCVHPHPELDEVVLSNVTVHIERMSDGHIWIGIDGERGHLAVNLFTAGRAAIWGRAEWDG